MPMDMFFYDVSDEDIDAFYELACSLGRWPSDQQVLLHDSDYSGTYRGFVNNAGISYVLVTMPTAYREEFLRALITHKEHGVKAVSKCVRIIGRRLQ
jgi:hypothetical protein